MQGTIYKITCLVTNKVYIGQTKQHYLNRFIQHKSHARTGQSHHKLANAFRKYGDNNFIIEILEECDYDKLDERERYWIQYYNSTDDNFGYNINLGGQDYSSYYQIENQDEIIEYYLNCHNQQQTIKHFGITEYKFRQILLKNNIATDYTNYGKHKKKKVKILELNKEFEDGMQCAKFLIEQGYTNAKEKCVRVGISRSIQHQKKYLKLTFVEINESTSY